MNKSLVIGCFAVIGMGFMSCSKDLYDSNAVNEKQNEKQKNDYATNFVKRYGEIDPNQTWDFATMAPISGLPSTGNVNTRAAGDGGATSVSVIQQSSGTMRIEKDVIDWMHEEFKAGANNSKKGSPFYLKTQEQTFTIVPFYQGVASYYWELWMNVGGVDVQVWSKNQDLTYKTSENGSSEAMTNNGVPAEAIEVNAPTYTYQATANQSLYFYLKIWKNGSKTTVNPDVTTSSLDKMMLALEGALRPASVPVDNEVTIIGCEDATDNDYEDLVFLIYGKPTPPITPVDEIEITETKRYMMEDLGTTDDFDFNDIVVDVQNVYSQKIYWKSTANGGWEESKRDAPVSKGQRAIVRAAGGIYDFTLKIGDKTWTKSQNLSAGSMLNTGSGGSSIHFSGPSSELAKFDVTGWIPKDNNVSVTVAGQDNNGILIKFPEAGEAPMMIAVDGDIDWMHERSGVPSNWFKDWFKK
jgi:hypothetical protein